MADDPQDITTTPDDSQAITIDSVDTFDAENLSDEQKTFLEENKSELTPEQVEKFGIEVEEKKEDINPDEIDPETRGGKSAKEEKKSKSTEEPDESEDDDDDIDPDDEKTIGKVVNKRLAPVQEALKQLQELRDQQEVDSYIRQNPDYERYRGAALKYMAHPAYKNIPAKNIMAIVAADGLQKLGAKKEREAAAKAKETQGNGQQQRKAPAGKPDYKGMSSTEFAEAKANILQGPRN